MTEVPNEPVIRNFMDLRVWKEAMNLVEACYRLSSTFPKEEMYGLTSQLRRASVSVPANIAEGYGRENKGSYAQFLRIAQGSLREVQTHLLLTDRLKLAGHDATLPVLEQCETVGKMLNGLIRSLTRYEVEA